MSDNPDQSVSFNMETVNIEEVPRNVSTQPSPRAQQTQNLPQVNPVPMEDPKCSDFTLLATIVFILAAVVFFLLLIFWLITSSKFRESLFNTNT